MSDHEHDELVNEFAEFLKDATAEGFARETSAVDEQPHAGATTFDAFVDERLRATRMAWIAAQGYMQPIGVLVNRDKQRAFTPDDDETLEDFIHRMHREAVAMEAIWTFVSKRTMIAYLGSREENEHLKGEDVGVAALQDAVAAGNLRLGVVWYAERVDQPRLHRHGQMPDEDGKLGQLLEGMPEQRIEIFERILNR